MTLHTAERDESAVAPSRRRPTRIPYPAYKDSGVEWLGEVPEGWEVKKLKFVAKINPSKTELAGLAPDTIVSFVPMEKIGENGSLLLDDERILQQISSGYTYFRNGDIVIAKITPCFENGKGALCYGLTNGIGFGSTELYVLRIEASQHYKGFIFYITKSEFFRRMGIASMYGAAGQQRISNEFIKDILVALPPLPEQRAIAAFLDRETEKIDRLIAKKERFIELLEEKRAALISHAVTKGLDPTAPMKDSGVEWLGEVPEGWEVKRLRSWAEIISGQSPNEETYNTDGVGSILVNGPAEYSESDFGQTRAIKWTTSPVKWAPKGSLLFCLRGSTTGRLNIAHDRISIGRGVAALVSHTDQSFLNYVMTMTRPIVLGTSNGSTFPSVTSETLRTYIMAVPPVSEQRAIAAFLDRETAKIDALTAKAREAIERLREYRGAVIAAAVTGKIDVRGEVEG